MASPFHFFVTTCACACACECAPGNAWGSDAHLYELCSNYRCLDVRSTSRNRMLRSFAKSHLRRLRQFQKSGREKPHCGGTNSNQHPDPIPMRPRGEFVRWAKKAKDRSDIMPNQGGLRPQRPCAQGRTCAKQDQAQASAPGQNRSEGEATTHGQRTRQCSCCR